MARKPRKASETGIYHVMLRGINRSKVFYDKKDENKFLEILANLKKKFNFKVYAYCFMGNHVHLLIKESESGLLSLFMKILLVRFVYWYNGVYRRCGSLFQSRFKSEPVEDVEYFRNVVRYIHQNPVKAKQCKHVWESRKSSYRYFFSEDPGIIDRDEVFEYISREEFEAFNDCQPVNSGDQIFIDLDENVPVRVADEVVAGVMKRVSGLLDLSEFDGMDKEWIWAKVREFRKRGLSYGQIARELRKNKGTVYKWAQAG